MKIFNITKNIIKDTRDILETSAFGIYNYQVLFNQTYRYDFYLFGKLIYTYEKNIKELDGISFKEKICAEWYAKNARKCCGHKYLVNYMDHDIYLMGDEKLMQYGTFRISCGNSGPVTLNNFNIIFNFKLEYTSTYSHLCIANNTVNINNLKNFTADECVNFVLCTYNLKGVSKKVVSSFDVIKMKQIPVIQPVSMEMQELKKLVDTFHEDQKLYIEITKKLLK
ncbi:MAG: hypothetical protein [Wendovervirus sonii]|uniref:Type I restriction modification DNA specificity domain-containing protein n=1 Tax=phage Lak_Megaphage_Sonny TaxID=3109229 RepID=A0ABZ0Z5S0_9CAUD|nr:MAG: hypothetical protein [phage Lak_Megaphage_Sonny]